MFKVTIATVFVDNKQMHTCHVCAFVLQAYKSIVYKHLFHFRLLTRLLLQMLTVLSTTKNMQLFWLLSHRNVCFALEAFKKNRFSNEICFLQCTAACDMQGVKYRILQCVWYGTKKPAGTACKDLSRPAVMKTCKGGQCSKSDSKQC